MFLIQVISRASFVLVAIYLSTFLSGRLICSVCSEDSNLPCDTVFIGKYRIFGCT
jgi:hypothetical protein